jgi:hypothetical protein
LDSKKDEKIYLTSRTDPLLAFREATEANQPILPTLEALN